MADVLKFDAAPLKLASKGKIEAARGDEYSFWPGLSQGLWVVSDPSPADPANSQGRVLLEMMLILCSAAAVAVAISFFVGAPPI